MRNLHADGPRNHEDNRDLVAPAAVLRLDVPAFSYE